MCVVYEYLYTKVEKCSVVLYTVKFFLHYLFCSWVCARVWMCVHSSLDPTHKSLGMRLCACVCAPMCVHVYGCLCVCLCVYACMCVCVCVCLYVSWWWGVYGCVLVHWWEPLTDIHKVMPNCFSFHSFLKCTSSYCALDGLEHLLSPGVSIPSHSSSLTSPILSLSDSRLKAKTLAHLQFTC